MKFEGVTFVDAAVKSMTKEEFIKSHIDVFFLDKKKEERKKILSDVYDTITK